jgi:hypothetical protein
MVVLSLIMLVFFSFTSCSSFALVLHSHSVLSHESWVRWQGPWKTQKSPYFVLFDFSLVQLATLLSSSDKLYEKTEHCSLSEAPGAVLISAVTRLTLAIWHERFLEVSDLQVGWIRKVWICSEEFFVHKEIFLTVIVINYNWLHSALLVWIYVSLPFLI